MNSSFYNNKILTKWSDDCQNVQLQDLLAQESQQMAEEIFDFDYDISQLMKNSKDKIAAMRTNKPTQIFKNKIKPMRMRKDRSMPATGGHLNILHEQNDVEVIKVDQLSDEIFEQEVHQEKRSEKTSATGISSLSNRSPLVGKTITKEPEISKKQEEAWEDSMNQLMGLIKQFDDKPQLIDSFFDSSQFLDLLKVDYSSQQLPLLQFDKLDYQKINKKPEVFNQEEVKQQIVIDKERTHKKQDIFYDRAAYFEIPSIQTIQKLSLFD